MNTTPPVNSARLRSGSPLPDSLWWPSSSSPSSSGSVSVHQWSGADRTCFRSIIRWQFQWPYRRLVHCRREDVLTATFAKEFVFPPIHVNDETSLVNGQSLIMIFLYEQYSTADWLRHVLFCLKNESISIRRHIFSHGFSEQAKQP